MLLHLRELQVQLWLECRVWEVCVYLPFIGSMYHKLPNSRLCGASAFPDPWTADLSKSLADPPAEVQSYLHGCILLTHSGEQRFDALHGCAVELTFRPFSNPNPLEEELRQPREVLLIPWRGADLTPGVPGWFTRGEFLSFSVLSSVTGEWWCPLLLCFTDVLLSGTLATPFDIWRWKMLD